MKNMGIVHTRDSLNTNTHIIVDGLDNSVVFLLPAENKHDCVHTAELLEKVDWHLYKERHLIACFFKIKWIRKITTRCDKLDSLFLAFVYLVSIAILVI